MGEYKVKNVEILIKNGCVIDPYNNICKKMDIGIDNGRIVVDSEMVGKESVDATDCCVVPGLIDYHTHIAAECTELGAVPDTIFPPMGVTTAVDAGSTGVSNYASFRRMSLLSTTRIKAFLNVCSAGLVTTSYCENINPNTFESEKILSFLDKYSDQLLGLKIRQSKEIAGQYGLTPMEKMIEIAEKARCQVVVHSTNPAGSPKDILKMLRPNDIYAHVYQGKGMNILENNHVIDEAFEARKRGIIFDAANGRNHFSFKIAQKALEESFLPDVISTDITAKTVFKGNRVFSLPFIMSKYLALGLSMTQIVERTTRIPACLIGKEKELGSLSNDTVADVTILRCIHKQTTFDDFEGAEKKGEKLIKTELTMRAGHIVFRQIDF